MPTPGGQSGAAWMMNSKVVPAPSPKANQSRRSFGVCQKATVSAYSSRKRDGIPQGCLPGSDPQYFSELALTRHRSLL